MGREELPPTLGWAAGSEAPEGGSGSKNPQGDQKAKGGEAAEFRRVMDEFHIHGNIHGKRPDKGLTAKWYNALKRALYRLPRRSPRR